MGSSGNRIHIFTFLQLVMLGILYALKSIKAVAVVFPFFIAALVPIRWSCAKIFSPEELHALDGHEEDDTPTESQNGVVFASGEVAQAGDAPVLLGNTAPRTE